MNDNLIEYRISNKEPQNIEGQKNFCLEERLLGFSGRVIGQQNPYRPARQEKTS
jgi:hypothetical protein